MNLRLVHPVHIPEAVYDAIVLTIDDPLMPTVAPQIINAQHFLVWADWDHQDVAIALIRGEDRP